MEVRISSAEGNQYAMNPQIEKLVGKRLMRVAQSGCTHFLLFASPLNQEVDLHSERVQQAVCALGEALPQIQNTKLPGMEQIRVTCINYMNFCKNGQNITLPDIAANYAICGCRWDQTENVFHLLIPTDQMKYQVAVAVELSCRAVPHEKTSTKWFRTVREPTPFYEVTFGKMSAFVNGSVIYTIGSRPYRYPVTEEMLGRTVLIRTYGEIPQFQSLAKGIILKND